MNDFDFENMQKKRIAQGARHRVCGSKSRKCSLPSDLLTAAQKRKLNGPVERYDMGKPIPLGPLHRDAEGSPGILPGGAP